MKNNPSNLLIDISEIPEEGLKLDLIKSPSFFEIEEANFKITKPISIHCNITKVDDEIYLRGTISSTIEIKCSRCLQSLTLSVDPKFEITYLPLTLMPCDEEVELEKDDMDISYYSNNIVDIIFPLRDQIVLSIPIKPLCTPDCAGLCPVCGQNLNIKMCSCYKSEDIDPRLSILKELKFQE
ncbi:MAG: DUF177 domain-containing protein [Nitrospinae bacterium]|nr:DUF177 domain-containing protein [Nitrospinota bacterium]